jgi:hypothetical protein
MVANTPRDVNLVAGAAGTFNAVSQINWNGAVVVTPGSLASGGALNINRTGGTVSVGPNASLQINSGATVNLLGIDALSDGVHHVAVANNGTFYVGSGIKNVGSISGSGNTNVDNGVTLFADAVRQSSLLDNGQVRIRPNGGAAGASKVDHLVVNGGILDVTNNNVILSDTVGSRFGTSYTGITGLIAQGRNGGTWNGASGIITSTASGSLTTLGVSSASQAKGIAATDTAVWSGQTVSGSDTLIMFTYGGDATLDGKINIDDYIRIDNGIANNSSGWSNGDFNYDCKINIDDYTQFIDANIGNQSGVFPSASSPQSLAVAAVPEPAAFLTIAPLAGLVLARRSRRRVK